MASMETPLPVEVLAVCPNCGTAYEEAQRLGKARIAVNTACPQCEAPGNPDAGEGCGTDEPVAR